MIIEIVSKTNSYVINGVQVEKGRLNISVSDGVVTVNNVCGTLDEVSINGKFYNSDDLFLKEISRMGLK